MSALALLSAAAAVPAVAAYPARDVLEAFAMACAEAEDGKAVMAGAEASGWEKLPDNADNPASRLARAGKAAATKHNPGLRLLDGGEYRKTVAGRTLYLAVSGVQQGKTASRGCRLYDFDAPRAFTAKELTAWSGREPTDLSDPSENFFHQVWAPGLKPEHQDMEAYFIGPGRNPLPGFEISGISLVASAVEF